MNVVSFRGFSVAFLSLSLLIGPAQMQAHGRGGFGGGMGGRGFGGGMGGRGFGGGMGGFSHPSFTPSPSFGRSNFSGFNNFNSGGFNRSFNMPSNNFRPGGNFNNNAINRGNFNQGNFNRGNFNQGNFNRNTFNQGNLNRNNFNQGNLNRNNFNQENFNRSTNINNNPFRNNANNFNNFNRTNNFRNLNNVNVNNINRNIGMNSWPGLAPYRAYHGNWYHGSWNWHHNPYWNSWGYFGLGYGMGLATWGLGSSLYNWGYMPYYNPYYVSPAVVQQPVVVQQPAVYDYSQPINTTSAPPPEETANAAVTTLDGAREAFKGGDYASALQQTDQALQKMPNDPTLHEFRALVLFAMKRYTDAAATLYTVLSASPGWDWTTMIGLYPNVDTYTEQLRALESFTKQNPDDAAARFVLAYQYMTQGYPDYAAAQLKHVTKLLPNDNLSARLLSQLSKPADDKNAPPDPQAQPPAAPAAPAGDVHGRWTATPAEGVTIALTVQPDGAFSWDLTAKSGNRKLSGTSTYENGMLSLKSTQGEPLAGTVTWKSADQFVFQAAGGGEGDPGLTFNRSN